MVLLIVHDQLPAIQRETKSLDGADGVTLRKLPKSNHPPQTVKTSGDHCGFAGGRSVPRRDASCPVHLAVEDRPDRSVKDALSWFLKT